MANAKKLPSGNYRVRIYVGNKDGKPQYKSFTGETKREAEFLAAQYNQSRIEECDGNITLAKAIEKYIASKENILSPSTTRGYDIILRNYLPNLMATKVKDITQSLLQNEFNDFAKDHMPKTCKNAYGLITAVLAVERPDFLFKVTLPRNYKREIFVPDEEQIKSIYGIVKGTDLEIPFILAAECGLRASEIAALKLKNVHNDYVYIKEAMVPDKNNKPALKDPKSCSGLRKIPISEEIYNLLVKNATNGRVCEKTSNAISNAWNKFKVKNGLNEDFVFHALRHHYASKCLLLGMPQKYISELMGHTDTKMIEQVYQHTFPSAMQTYADLIRKSSSGLFDMPQNVTQ